MELNDNIQVHTPQVSVHVDYGISPEFWGKLSPKTSQYLKELVNPSKEVEQKAWEEFCRRNKLVSQGLKIFGASTFRVSPRHVRTALNISSLQAGKCLSEARDVYLEVNQPQKENTNEC